MKPIEKTKAKPQALIFTCEHASREIPPDLSSLFRGKTKLLKSHRGFDEEALPIAEQMSTSCKAPLYSGHYSRMVVDLNRSANHPRVFSEITKGLPQAERDRLIQTLHRPFREYVQAHILRSANKGKSTLHLSIHSFTPVLSGEVRNCEIGLLYDPRRKLEMAFAQRLKVAIQNEFATSTPTLRIRMNYPYRGYSDGHTTALRKLLSKTQYMGLELEFNQAWLRVLVSQNQLLNMAERMSRAIKSARI